MTAIKGGEFLIRQTKPEEVFIPEEWSEEEKRSHKHVAIFWHKR